MIETALESKLSPKFGNKKFKPLVLLVDDNKKHRVLYEKVIIQAGFSVIAVDSAEKAKVIIETMNVDILLYEGNLSSEPQPEHLSNLIEVSSKRTLPVIEMSLGSRKTETENQVFCRKEKPKKVIKLLYQLTSLEKNSFR